VRLDSMPAGLTADLSRITALWNDGLDHFGGPFLAGSAFSAADAFFAPIAFRIQTYQLDVEPVSRAYVERMLSLESMRSWYAAGLLEPWRDEPHEKEIAQCGQVIQDLRA